MILSIVLPTIKLDTSLCMCLKSIKDSMSSCPCELIIVLDGIREDKTFFRQFELSNCKIIEIDVNSGPACARNVGARVAQGEVLFFIDSDITIYNDTLIKVWSHFTNPSAEDALIGSYDDAPAYPSLISKYRNLLHHHTHQTASSETSTFWGACGAIRSEVFWTVGGFYTAYIKPSVEDIEFGYRIKDHGYRIKLDNTIIIKHWKQWTLVKMIETDVWYRAKPWTLLLLNRKSVYNELNTSFDERLASLSIVLMILCVFTGLLFPVFWMFSCVFPLTVLLIKYRVYSFFSQYFTKTQMLIVILLHWLYLLCAFIGFVLGVLDYSIANITSINRANRTKTKLRRL